MIRIAHIITGLDIGGAETMLYNLLSATDRIAFAPQVICLKRLGKVAQKISELGIPVRSLNMNPQIPNPAALLRLAWWLRRGNVDVVQTWMYHADLIGGLAAKLAGIPLAWGIHHTSLDLKTSSRYMGLITRLLAQWSHRMPEKIVVCSMASKAEHLRRGYLEAKMIFIPNGFNLDVFHPDPEARVSARSELGIPHNALIIGMAARFNPQKDLLNFVMATTKLHHQLPDTYFVICGKEMTYDNVDLAGWIDEANLRSHIHLLGIRNDMPRLYSAFDISTLSSRAEAFPMTLGEAMACGVPCVATDVGDTAYLIGDTGIVVPAKDPEALAEAWLRILRMPFEERRELGANARRRVQEQFNLSAISAQFAAMYQELAASRG